MYNDPLINNFYSTGRVSNVDNLNNPYSQRARLSQDNTVIPSQLGDAAAFVDYLKNTFEMLLCTSLDNYIYQATTNKVAFQLEAYGSDVLFEKATSDITEMMDLSRSLAPEELQELVNRNNGIALLSLTKDPESGG